MTAFGHLFVSANKNMYNKRDTVNVKHRLFLSEKFKIYLDPFKAVCIYLTLSLWAGYDTRSIFKQSKAGFFFYQLSFS